MTENQTAHRSMWEHAGFPGIPNGHATPDVDEVDEVFKRHFRKMLDDAAPAVERAESALSWSVLREDDFREDLAYNYDWEVLNQAEDRDPGIAEELDYQQQLDAVHQEVADDVEIMRREGKAQKHIDGFIRYATAYRINHQVKMKRPSLPPAQSAGQEVEDSMLWRSLGIGAVWTAVTFTLAILAHLLRIAGPITNLLAHSAWLYVPAVLLSIPVAAIPFYLSLSSEVEFYNRWLNRDWRSFWPMFTWGAANATSVIVFPFWVTAILAPVSAAVLLGIPQVRRRLLTSVGGVDAPMLEPQELLGRDAQFGPNLFVPTNVTTKALGPALPPSLPHISRDGSSADSIYATQERVAELAAHCSVEPSGMAEDVHKITAALLLDVVMGITGADDLRLVAQYGGGPRHIVARAIAIGTGQEPLMSASMPERPKPGRAVAPWWESETEAYKKFVGQHLSADDAATAFSAAVEVLLQARDFDFPHESLFRLETITYALRIAASTS